MSRSSLRLALFIAALILLGGAIFGWFLYHTLETRRRTREGDRLLAGRGHEAAAREYRAALEAAGRVPGQPHLRAPALLGLGSALAEMGPSAAAEAEARLEEALAAFDDMPVGGALGAAEASSRLGDLALRSGDAARAEARYARAVEAAARWAPDSDAAVRRPLAGLYRALERQGRRADAEAVLARLARALGTTSEEVARVIERAGAATAGVPAPEGASPQSVTQDAAPGAPGPATGAAEAPTSPPAPR